MLNKIAEHLNNHLTTFTEDDSIIFNNQHHPINQNNFSTIIPQSKKSITYIDGGQAEILTAANFNISFIRVAAVIFNNNHKSTIKKEFFIVTIAEYQNDDIYYKSKIFGDQLINEHGLIISSNHSSIKNGSECAPISKVANMARRFSELTLASSIQSDFILLDGTLEPTFPNEKIYLNKLSTNTAALAKSSSLFTTSGNSPNILLNKLGPKTVWKYQLNQTTSFIKLHSQSKHIFRFEGNPTILPHLINNSTDPIFLGYPYGLILADKVARVSNSEKQSLTMKFLLNSKNQSIINYLKTQNAHSILDSI